MTADMKSSSVCPICGQDTPHLHGVEELKQLYEKVAFLESKLGIVSIASQWKQRAADLQARQERVEEALRSIISSEKRGETAEYLAHIAIRALSAQPKAAAGQEAAYPSGEDAVTSGQPAPSAAPIPHSKSQYKRLVAQGADVAPPDAAPASDWPFKVLEP